MSANTPTLERMVSAVKNAQQALKVLQDENKQLKEENKLLKERIAKFEQESKPGPIVQVIVPLEALAALGSADRIGDSSSKVQSQRLPDSAGTTLPTTSAEHTQKRRKIDQPTVPSSGQTAFPRGWISEGLNKQLLIPPPQPTTTSTTTPLTPTKDHDRPAPIQSTTQSMKVVNGSKNIPSPIASSTHTASNNDYDKYSKPKLVKFQGSKQISPDLINTPEKDRASLLLQLLSKDNYRNLAKALSSHTLPLVLKAIIHCLLVSISKQILEEWKEIVKRSYGTVPALPPSYKQKLLLLVKLILAIATEKESGSSYAIVLLREFSYRLLSSFRSRLQCPLQLLLLSGLGKMTLKQWQQALDAWKDTLKFSRPEDTSSSMPKFEDVSEGDVLRDQRSSDVEAADEQRRQHREELAWMLSLSDDEEEVKDTKDVGTDKYSTIVIDVDIGEKEEENAATRIASSSSQNPNDSNKTEEGNTIIINGWESNDQCEILEIEDGSNGVTEKKMLELEDAVSMQKLLDYAKTWVLVTTLIHMEESIVLSEFMVALQHHVFLPFAMGFFYPLLYYRTQIEGLLDKNSLVRVASVMILQEDAILIALRPHHLANLSHSQQQVRNLYQHLSDEKEQFKRYALQLSDLNTIVYNAAWQERGILGYLQDNATELKSLLPLHKLFPINKFTLLLKKFQFSTKPLDEETGGLQCSDVVHCSILECGLEWESMAKYLVQEITYNHHKISQHISDQFSHSLSRSKEILKELRSLHRSLMQIGDGLLSHWRCYYDEVNGGIRTGSTLEGVHLTILAKTKVQIVKDLVSHVQALTDYPSEEVTLSMAFDYVLDSLFSLYQSTYTNMHSIHSHHQLVQSYQLSTHFSETADKLRGIIFSEHCSISLQEVQLIADIVDHVYKQYLLPYNSLHANYLTNHRVHTLIKKIYHNTYDLVQYVVFYQLEKIMTMVTHTLKGLLECLLQSIHVSNVPDASNQVSVYYEIVILIISILYDFVPCPWGMKVDSSLQVLALQLMQGMCNRTTSNENESELQQRKCRLWQTKLLKAQSNYSPLAIVINLDRRPDRWKSVLKEACKWRFSVYRVSAVDGKVTKNSEVDEIPEQIVTGSWDSTLNSLFDSRYVKPPGQSMLISMTLSERACAMSHLLTWIALHDLHYPPMSSITSSYNEQIDKITREIGFFQSTMQHLLQGYYLICEDDFSVDLQSIVNNTKEQINQVVSYYNHNLLTELVYLLQRAPKDADLIYLGGILPQTKASHFSSYVQSIFLRVNYVWQLHGYLIHHSVLPKILQSLPINMPVDNFLASLAYQEQIKIYVLKDPIMKQRGGGIRNRAIDSDIVHSIEKGL